MWERIFSLFILGCLVVGCQKNPTEQVSDKPRVLPQDTLTRLVVALNDFRMREAPGTDKAEVSLLQSGTILETTGNISPQKSEITIRGVKRNEPWIEVKTSDGKIGWVFGGGVKVEGNTDTPVAQILRKERLASLFGEVKTRQILQYRTDYKKASNPKDFENVYIRGTILRDSLSRIIPEKIQILDHEKLPELSWLDDALPGYTLGIVAEGTTYYPFQDYDKMAQKAEATTGDEDNRFIELLRKIFDGKEESFYPVWFMQTWDYGGNSLLGQGKHLEMLEEMDGFVQSTPLFKDPILKLKKRLLDDILDNPEKQYQESADNIIKEIDAIILKDLSIISDTEKTKLENKKMAFLNPEESGLTLDMGKGF